MSWMLSLCHGDYMCNCFLGPVILHQQEAPDELFTFFLVLYLVN